MRRVNREITSKDEILAIIDQCKVCRIAMIDNERPYIVPLNFGYTYNEGMIELYVHSALKGRKIDILQKDQIVCVEMDCEHELVESEVPCQNGYLYASVIGEGKITFIEEIEEKKAALNELMKHIVGKTFGFEDGAVGSVAVYKLTLTKVSAKARRV